MKTLSKILLAGAALLMGNSVSAQGKSGTHANTHAQTHINTSGKTSGKTVRETARVNGSVNANAHANVNAKNHANDNSVLNGGTSTTVTTKTHKAKRTRPTHTRMHDNDSAH
jgi:uncharacterized protein YggE